MTTAGAGKPVKKAVRVPRPYGVGRDALLAAAVKVVASQGLRHLTYRAVAQEAGVTHGLVSHHFGTRDALIEAALQYSLDGSVVGITADPGSGRIDALFRGLAELVNADPDTQAFQYELVLEARRRPELRSVATTLYESYRAALRVEFERAGLGSDEAVVHLVFAALDGLVFQRVCQVDDVPIDQALDRLRRMVRQLLTDPDG
jgi:AcrR family transcriptional regulator